MDDDLASEYDVVVLGTGMPECILAAALARVGKNVLHLDRNEYYGGEWASFNFDGLQRWIENNQTNCSQQIEAVTCDAACDEGETLVPVASNAKVINNVKTVSYVREKIAEETAEDVPATKLQLEDLPVECKESTGSQLDPVDNKHETAEVAEEIGETAGETEQVESETIVAKPKCEKKEWYWQDLKAEWRKFNLDLAPKVLFSQGSLVNLLISSNIARYAEFKCVTRVLTYLDGKLEQVPCSRADVFSTRDVTIVEKRMLMKLLTFCIEYEHHPDEYQDFEDKTFVNYLKSRKLTPNVQHYVLNAIAMVPKETSTIEGLKAVQRFLKSLGRYGNTPFLWPLYGSGELPQCFCRLCAVFGGVYYLKRAVDALILDSDGRLRAVLSRNKKIKCQWLVAENSYLSLPQYKSTMRETKISRGIFITDKSILKAEKEQITMLRLPVSGALKSAVNVLELGSSSMACPVGLHVVHMTCEQVSTAENDLKFALEILFESGQSGDNSSENKKPKILWCMYFNRTETVPESVQSLSPTGIVVTSGPGSDLDFDHAVAEAKKYFLNMFPDEEFLPRAPDPDEIVLDGEEGNNPGPEFAASELETGSATAVEEVIVSNKMIVERDVIEQLSNEIEKAEEVTDESADKQPE